MKYGFILGFLLSSFGLASHASNPAQAQAKSPYNQQCFAKYSLSGYFKFEVTCDHAQGALQRASKNDNTETLKNFQICLNHTSNGTQQCYSPRENIGCAAAVELIKQVQESTVKS